MHFCKGLYLRFTNQPREAVEELNLARVDGEWGEAAILNMVSTFVCCLVLLITFRTLCVQVEILILDMLWTSADEAPGDVELQQRAEAVDTAQRLLGELPARPKPLRQQCLEAFALLATKKSKEIEKGLNSFLGILQSHQDCVPALLGASTALVRLYC